MSAGAERRVERMFASLTARERAVHIIQSWKQGKQEDGALHRSTPPEQMREVNELVALARCINREFALLVLVDEQAAAKLQMQFGWLQSLRAWSLSATSIRRELVLAVPEYVTEEERDARVAELGREEWTLEQAAQHLSDIDESRDAKGWKTALAAAVGDGSLVATGKGRSLRIRYGDVCSWRGEEVPLMAEWGFEAEVHSDQGTVRMRRAAHEAIRANLDRAPAVLAPEVEVPDELPEDAGTADQMAFRLVVQLEDELVYLWRELRCVETIIGEVRVRLGGEDPADKMIRETLDRSLAAIREVADGLEEEGIEVELEEPEEEEMEPYRAVVRRFVKQETGW